MSVDGAVDRALDLTVRIGAVGIGQECEIVAAESDQIDTGARVIATFGNESRLGSSCTIRTGAMVCRKLGLATA